MSGSTDFFAPKHRRQFSVELVLVLTVAGFFLFLSFLFFSCFGLFCLNLSNVIQKIYIYHSAESFYPFMYEYKTISSNIFIHFYPLI